MNTTPKCAACPVSEGTDCLAQIDPRFAGYCRLALEGNDTDRRHIVDRAKIGIKPAMPSLARQAVNLATATAQHIAAGARPASETERERRLAICRANTCGQYLPGDKCAKCGCRMEIKAAWAEQSCPLDPPLWGPVLVPAPQPASERLEVLVAECDYRGGIVTAGGCKCSARWHCAMGRGDAAHPYEATKAQCLQCVLGPTSLA